MRLLDRRRAVIDRRSTRADASSDPVDPALVEESAIRSRRPLDKAVGDGLEGPPCLLVASTRRRVRSSMNPGGRTRRGGGESGCTGPSQVSDGVDQSPLSPVHRAMPRQLEAIYRVDL